MIERIRNYAVDNIKCAKELQKRHYDKRSRPHTFAVCDKVYLKIQRRKLNEDTKLRNQYCSPCFIEKFTSPTNVTLRNKTDKELPRSALINNLNKCQIMKQFNIPGNNISQESDSPSLSSRAAGQTMNMSTLLMMLLVLTFLTVMMTNLSGMKIVPTLQAATYMVMILLLIVFTTSSSVLLTVVKCHQMRITLQLRCMIYPFLQIQILS